MKPLSVFNYNRNNKIRFFSSIASVAVAVGFLYILITFVKSTENSIYRTILNFKNYSMCLPYSSEKGISLSLILKIEGSKAVEKVIPVKKYGIQYDIPYESAVTKLLAVKNEDMNCLLIKSQDNILQGRLPRDGENEIAVNYYEAKNQKIKLGDIVGGEKCKLYGVDGEYKVVGIIGGKNLISILSANEDSMPNYKNAAQVKLNGIIVFPRNGCLEEMNKFLEAISKKQIITETLGSLNNEFNQITDGLGTLNALVIASIFLMVVTVGGSRYIQFFSRKEELGILNAIGYSKKKILKRAVIEVLEVNILSYIIGVSIGVCISFLIKKCILEVSGSVGVVFDLKAFIVALYIPLFTALFTIIPINIIISRLDPINMIEEN
ncbi:FtsX-like permease family protein [Clostridium neuense]|uniref:FtsX-like permease family protein n=1 Tax=Clostridium neuense TaxID=1728934 RepID=A0ABW8TCB6_9CLOT